MRKASELTGICGGAAVEVRDGICTRPFESCLPASKPVREVPEMRQA